MRIGFAQIAGKPDFKENLEQCLDYMILAGKLELDLICFPEMHLTDFFLARSNHHYPFQFAEGIPGPSAERFQRLARELKMVVVLNYMERFNYEFFSASPVIDSTGKLLGVSRMVHVPQIEGYYAQSYFTPSCGDFKVYNTQSGRLGVLISYDRHFPEATRALALRDADIILIPGYIAEGQNLDMFRAELRTIAYQNSVFVGLCSRAGKEKNMRFVGRSMLVGPDGEIIVEGSSEPELVVAEIDLTEVRRRRKENPYLTLRRPDEYLYIIKQY
ncbi:MAG TPA: carbon-nitrogen hydrolase family protein [Clostridiales bacterium]|nr:carbon-nitrogen hydrolase family protein [Clostridiales bacterium]